MRPFYRYSSGFGFIDEFYKPVPVQVMQVLAPGLVKICELLHIVMICEHVLGDIRIKADLIIVSGEE